MDIISVNPANGKNLKKYKAHTTQQVEKKIAQTHKTWLSWKTTSFAERATLLNKLAEVLQSRKDELAKLMALEMGKPIAQGISEVEKCASSCQYYAQNAEAHLK